MPKLDGFEVVRRLREHGGPQGVPIVMLTEHSAEEDVLCGLRLGVDEYMPKPFSPRELSVRLAGILARSEAGGAPAPAEGDRFPDPGAEPCPDQHRVLQSGLHFGPSGRRGSVSGDVSAIWRSRGRPDRKRMLSQRLMSVLAAISPAVRSQGEPG